MKNEQLLLARGMLVAIGLLLVAVVAEPLAVLINSLMEVIK